MICKQYGDLCHIALGLVFFLTWQVFFGTVLKEALAGDASWFWRQGFHSARFQRGGLLNALVCLVGGFVVDGRACERQGARHEGFWRHGSGGWAVFF